MNTAVINIKTQPETKIAAQRVAAELGISLSGLINGFLKHLVRTKRIEFTTQPYELTAWAAKALEQSLTDTKAGKVSPTFDNSNDALAWLKNPQKKYADQIR